MSKKVEIKTLRDIAAEWDSVCIKRAQTIEQGKDISLKYVTAPCVIRNLREAKVNSVLDVGCGTGYLTNELSKVCNICYGIDVSQKSIQLANEKYKVTGIVFNNCSIARFKSDIQFDSCVANMVFMTDPDWIESLKNIHCHLSKNGVLFSMITHPCFWPFYWGYAKESWFAYNKEIFIENEFHTSMSEPIGITTHIHRPLSTYINGFKLIGFDIEGIEEPRPVEGTPSEYIFDYPRFLLFKCRKR